MSHRNSDFDSVGAQYGIYRIAATFKKPCYIVADRVKTLAPAAYDSVERMEGGGIIVSPQQALELCGAGWLCVTVDTNRPALVESPELWKKASRRAVVDHHNRHIPTLEHVDVFAGDPSYSSCGEIFSELLQQLGVSFNPTLCDLLLAGLMLDTHYFSQKTTNRTFRSAALLVESGGKVNNAYNFFDTDHDDYIARAKIVSRADIRDGYALSVASRRCINVRTVAPQAADEMLTLRGVKAAFVLYRVEGLLYISARGADYDVAEIMEKMGGGGNRTMAGAQIDCLGTRHIIRKLRKAIAEYLYAHPEAAPQ